MELDPVHVPRNLGRPPVSRRAIPLNLPRMPVLVRNGGTGPPAAGFVARTAGIRSAVEGSVPPQITVDGLQDIELTTGGPAAA